MIRCICGTCGTSFESEQICCCPNCGSEDVYVKTEDRTVGVFGSFNDNDRNTKVTENKKEETVTFKAEKVFKDYVVDDPVTTKLPEKNNKKKTLIILAAVIGAVIIAGIILLVVFMGNKEDARPVDNSNSNSDTEASSEVKKRNISFEAKTVSSIRGAERKWILKDGTRMTARTGGVYYVEMLYDDGEARSDGFTMTSSNTSLVEINGNQMIVKEINEYDTVRVTISANGEEDISFYLNVKHGGWNEIDGKWYYIEENDKPLTGWLQIYEDEMDRAYYLKEDGSMVSDTTITFGSGDEAYACKFDRLGRLYDSWLVLDGNVYRYGPEKVMLKNTTAVIGDGTYRFDENGVAYSE